MTQTILFFFHSALLLLFGVFLSAAFSGTKLTLKNSLMLLGFCALCGAFQLVMFLMLSEESVWRFYPLITHLPTVLFLTLFFRKRLGAAVLSLLVAYLLCQPPKWFGVFTFQLTQSASAEYLSRILCLLAVAFLSLKYAAPCLSEIFTKGRRTVLIFGIVPMVYYLFDYIAVIYTDFWHENALVVAEFLPMLLCVAFVIFCMVYYRQHEQRADAERKEQIITTVAQQQAVQIERVKQVEQELRMARHDMRHLLERVALCMDAGDTLRAKEMLQDYITFIDGTRLTTFCQFDTINYILSAFATHCAAEHITLHCDIQLETLDKDETLFCSILQNALDNAYHAQKALPEAKREIHVLLKNMDNKLLLSVKNPLETVPIFADGLPISREPGHGYGAQSIRYLSERLGGSCQFSVRDGLFLLRVVL